MKHEKHMSLSDFPDYVTAAAKLAEVKARLADAEAERDSLLAAIAGARDRRETLADQAQRLLNGDDGAIADLGSLRENYSRACRQVALHAEVVRLATLQIETERAAASRDICDAARPEFANLVLAELQAAHDLLAAQAARREYWQRLDAAGVNMATMPAVAPVLKGDLRDPTGIFWVRAADAERLGLVEAGTFPRPVRKPGHADPLHRAGVRLLASGPEGIGLVETVGDGRAVRPVPGQWHATPKPAKGDGWTDAA